MVLPDIFGRQVGKRRRGDVQIVPEMLRDLVADVVCRVRICAGMEDQETGLLVHSALTRSQMNAGLMLFIIGAARFWLNRDAGRVFTRVHFCQHTANE